MQATKTGEVEWTAYTDGDIEFHQPDAIETKVNIIKDVLQAGEDNRLKEFIVTFNKLNLQYGVDLKTGEFIFGGVKHDLAPEVPKCNLRLIHYVRKRGQFSLNQFVFKKRPAEAGERDDTGQKWQIGTDMEQYGWIEREGTASNLIVKPYRILVGWQTTCDGKNHQRILFIDPETGKTELRGKR